MSDNKSRLQFDFDPDALVRIDAMKEKMGVETRAEVIREALRVYEFLLENFPFREERQKSR